MNAITRAAAELLPITVADQLIELRRELTMREGVYPRWVADGRLSSTDAARRIARLRAAIQTLELVAAA